MVRFLMAAGVAIAGCATDAGDKTGPYRLEVDVTPRDLPTGLDGIQLAVNGNPDVASVDVMFESYSEGQASPFVFSASRDGDQATYEVRAGDCFDVFVNTDLRGDLVHEELTLALRETSEGHLVFLGYAFLSCTDAQGHQAIAID
jgi:hypothetical protein